MTNDNRNHVGYGSTYWKGSDHDNNESTGLSAVLAGQIWTVKPDKEAKAKNSCLWASAGVVKSKDCVNFYDCANCKYDHGMRKAVESGKRDSWQDMMRKRPSMDRVCRHSLTNRIARRICAYDYICETCDFDQYFEETVSQKSRSTPQIYRSVKGFDVPENHYFHKGHTWARIESGGIIRIGLDDFAFKVLGPVDLVELPLMGKELKAGKAGWGLKRNENEAPVLAPVSGVIMEVNANVRENSSIAYNAPYSDGWLLTVKNKNLEKSVEGLMVNASGLDWMDREVSRLESMIEAVNGPLAADGGLIQPDVFGNLPKLGWKALTEAFLAV